MVRILTVSIVFFLFPKVCFTQELIGDGLYGISFAEIETLGCCKICTSGKACGDSCINASYNCYKGSGCACNAPISMPQPTATPVPRATSTPSSSDNRKKQELIPKRSRKVKCPPIIADINTGEFRAGNDNYDCFTSQSVAEKWGYIPKAD
jgi:hypothetical protein